MALLTFGPGVRMAAAVAPSQVAAIGNTTRPAAVTAVLVKADWSVAAQVALPCFASFVDGEGGDYQPGDRVGPPPTEGGVGNEADEGSGRQVRAH